MTEILTVAGLVIAVLSFAYRWGLPREADLVFDVRFLANPHYVPALQPLTGRDPEVGAFVEFFSRKAERTTRSRLSK